MNPFEYEPLASREFSCVSYECDPKVNGEQNTISFMYNSSDFSGYNMTSVTNKFYPCMIHIYGQYAPIENKQNENFIY